MLPREASGQRTPRLHPRALRRLATAAAIILAAGALAACGDEDEDAEPAGGDTDLVIVLDRDGHGGRPAGEALIRCTGSEAIPTRAACRLVERLSADAAEPVPPDVACTEIYGGPDEVLAEGELKGEPIRTELIRTNGCEIGRFDRWTPLLRALFPGYRPGEALAP